MAGIGTSSAAPGSGEEQRLPQVAADAGVPASDATTTEATSTAETGEQEQGVDELDEAKLDDLIKKDKRLQAKVYREAQSMKDRELAKERLRRQQEQEQQRLKSMSNSEYGAYLREKEALAQAAQGTVKAALETAFQQAQDAVLSQLDPTARQRVEAELNSYQNLGDFLAGAARAKADSEAQRKIDAELKQAREAIRKELQAEMSDQFAPDLSRGTPTNSKSRMHGIQAISAGFEEKLQEARRQKR